MASYIAAAMCILSSLYAMDMAQMTGSASGDFVTACPGGQFGVGCANECDCGPGNTCDMNGACICNSCYHGDYCEKSKGYTCFLEFLAIRNKFMDPLMDLYGLIGYPIPQEDQLPTLVASGLHEISENFVQNQELVVTSRESVDQGPLVTLKWRVDKTKGVLEAEDGLNTLRNKVKKGDIAATLIIQNSIDYAEVTLNAGIKRADSN